MGLVYQEGAKVGRERASALAVSLLVHAVAIFVAVNASSFSVPSRAPSEYKQKIEGRDSKLVWYKFRKDLPSVDPVTRHPDNRPLRAEAKAEQAIVSSPKNAPKRTQMVWTPAPELVPAPPVESPNILAVKLPPKQFIAPPAPKEPVGARAQLAADAPVPEARQDRAPELPQLRLPPKAFVAPPQPVRISVARVIDPVEAPPLNATTLTNAGAPPMVAQRLPPRPFTVPPSSGRSVGVKSVSIDSLPPPDLPTGQRDLNVAIVGLNPLDKMVPPPTASSRAEFSAGPQPRASGAVSEGSVSGLSVPDLFVRGARNAKPDLIAEAYAAPTSSVSLRAAIRAAQPAATVHADPSVPQHSASAKVSGAPDPRFNGRDVYLMAIQMPNLTSYSGSWLMWYSGRTAREVGLEPISAPVPHRKVDPKYVATAVEERIEGRVQLACVIDREGKVSAVEVVRGLDDRLNESAREALSKWEFYPALRSGAPVDVDVLVEIPFRLAPRVAAR